MGGSAVKGRKGEREGEGRRERKGGDGLAYSAALGIAKPEFYVNFL